MIKMNFLLFMEKQKHICLFGYYVVSSANWAIIFRAVDGNKGILGKYKGKKEIVGKMISSYLVVVLKIQKIIK